MADVGSAAQQVRANVFANPWAIPSRLQSAIWNLERNGAQHAMSIPSCKERKSFNMDTTVRFLLT